MMVWVDIETTGLDPVECDILEVALVVTDDEGEVQDRESWVIARGTGRVEGWPLRQHVASGLWKEASASAAWHIRPVESSIIAWLAERPTVKPPMMCGSSVHFDRAFLRVHMPLVHAWFHYRNFDVTTLATFAEMMGAEDIWPEGDSPHRALPDLERSIETFRRCVKWARR